MKIIETNLLFKNSELKRRPASKIVLIILHHTCSKNADVYSINQDHKKRGWAGIGYHFVIGKDGKVYRGRPEEYVGAHCSGNNTSSIGIALCGDFRTESPTDEQLKSLDELVKLMRAKYPIRRVLNHNDLYATACPVINLKSLVSGV